MVYVCLTVR